MIDQINIDNFMKVSQWFVDKAEELWDVFHYFWIRHRLTTFEAYSNLEITLMAIIAILVSANIYWYVCSWLEITYRRGMFRIIDQIPIVRYFVRKEMGKFIAGMKSGLPKAMHGVMAEIPKKGWTKKQLIDRLDEYHEEEFSHTKSGKYSGIRFSDRKDIEEIAGEGSKRFLYSNMLYFNKTGPSRNMELEIIAFCNKLLHGEDSYTGMTTTGGSESIFQAILAHKRYYFQEHGIAKPEIVLPETAHPAFYKACDYLDVKYTQVKCNNVNGLPYMKQYEKKITSNTILLVGSAPNLAFGTVDPQDEIGELAGKYNTGFFIDGCMGSMLLPFVDDFNVKTGQKYVDLRNKNVTAMSCDIHKYGMCPKGISVLVFAKREVKLALHWSIPDWIGGIYGTAGIQGSRPSHTIAAAWSVMMYHGYDEYARIAKIIFDATDYLVEEVKKIPELRIIGNPRLGNVTITSKDPKFDIFLIGEFLNEKGWYLNSGFNPKTMYCTIHEKNSGIIPLLVSDLKQSLVQFKNGEKCVKKGDFKLYGSMGNIPNSIVNATLKECIEATYDLDEMKADKK